MVLLETRTNVITHLTPFQTENSERERDVYEELLTQAEIQGNINKVNSKYVPESGTCGAAAASRARGPLLGLGAQRLYLGR